MNIECNNCKYKTDKIENKCPNCGKSLLIEKEQLILDSILTIFEELPEHTLQSLLEKAGSEENLIELFKQNPKFNE